MMVVFVHGTGAYGLKKANKNSELAMKTFFTYNKPGAPLTSEGLFREIPSFSLFAPTARKYFVQWKGCEGEFDGKL